MAPSFFLSHTFGLSSLGLCGQVQVHSQRVNMLDELKAQITAATAKVTENMLTAHLARG
jgi:hypothetical protein